MSKDSIRSSRLGISLFRNTLLTIIVASILIFPQRVAATTIGVFPQQHEQTTTADAVGDMTGKYETVSSMKIQSAHKDEKPHPYPLPDGSLHHHAVTPTKFIFTETFDIVREGNPGSESLLLPGFPRVPAGMTHDDILGTDPYLYNYETSLWAEGNASFIGSKDHLWTGDLEFLVRGGSLESFGFSLFGFGLEWQNDNSPSSIGVLTTFTGDLNVPVFTFQYSDGIEITHAALSINGYVLNEDKDEFGRIGSDGWATIAEDTHVLPNQGIKAYLNGGSYDVTHGTVPLPAAVWLFGTALIGLVGFSKRRKAA